MAQICPNCHKSFPKSNEFCPYCMNGIKASIETRERIGIPRDPPGLILIGVSLIGVVFSVIFMNTIDLLLGSFSLWIYLVFTIGWYIAYFGKRRKSILLVISVSYIALVCLLLFWLGIGVYMLLPMLLLHATNAGYLFLMTLMDRIDLRWTISTNKDVNKRPSLRSIMLHTLAAVILLLGLIGLVAYKYSSVAQETSGKWSEFTYSPAHFERYLSIIYFARNGDAISIHPLLRDPNSDVANRAYNAIWKLHKDESIPVLIEFLWSRDDKSKALSLAGDYLNSGNPALEAAATAWAQQFGYKITIVQSSSSSEKW